MAKVDIQARAQYIASQEGGIRAGARAMGLPYSTFRRIVKGEVKTSKQNRAKLNRNFRKKAPKGVLKREKDGLGVGFALVEEKEARKLEASYRKQGLQVRVVARQKFTKSFLGVGEPQNQVEYGQGSSVDAAKANLAANFARFGVSYADEQVSLVGKTKYRVIPKVVA
ncbi:MAG: hypothetical protein ACW987_15395 [Candidatus Thorarchaeota archaeon]|jgi:hypothetical protein